jgi:hypothetical protein
MAVDHFTDGPLAARLARALDAPGGDGVERPFLSQLADPARGARAVLLYGSCLWPAVRRADSEPDFLVIVESLRGWHRALGGVLLGAVLPPSVIRLSARGRRAKASIVTEGQLLRATSDRAADLHLAGRLSKRVRLVWQRDADARRSVVHAQLGALRLLGRLVLARSPGGLTVEEFARALIGISYAGERRIAERGKIDALFEAERDHYLHVAAELLALIEATPGLTPTQVERRLARSRRRGLFRWPKYLLTFDGWLEYSLAKLDRVGVSVALSARQRQHPLVFGWPTFIRLARNGVIR